MQPRRRTRFGRSSCTPPPYGPFAMTSDDDRTIQWGAPAACRYRATNHRVPQTKGPKLKPKLPEFRSGEARKLWITARPDDPARHAAADWSGRGAISSSGVTRILCIFAASSTDCCAVAGMRPTVRQYWITDAGRPILLAASRTFPKRLSTSAIWVIR